MSAMANEQLINKLVQLTESKSLRWFRITQYLENNNNTFLEKYLIAAHKYFYSSSTIDVFYWPMIQEHDSFCAEFRDGLVILFSLMKKDYKTSYSLAVQVNRESLVRMLDGNEGYQTKLYHLWQCANEGGKSAESFIEDILNQ